MASLKKPKLKNLPKKPKTSASLAVWDRYNKKVADVQKINNERVKDYNAKFSAKEAKMKKVAAIGAAPKHTVKFKN